MFLCFCSLFLFLWLLLCSFVRCTFLLLRSVVCLFVAWFLALFFQGPARAHLPLPAWCSGASLADGVSFLLACVLCILLFGTYVACAVRYLTSCFCFVFCCCHGSLSFLCSVTFLPNYVAALFLFRSVCLFVCLFVCL